MSNKGHRSQKVWSNEITNHVPEDCMVSEHAAALPVRGAVSFCIRTVGLLKAAHGQLTHLIHAHGLDHTPHAWHHVHVDTAENAGRESQAEQMQERVPDLAYE